MMPPAMVDLRGKLPAIGEYPKRDVKGLRFIVIHHSGTDYDSDSAGIARYHMGLGWATVGYAYVSRWDGTIEWCHDDDVQGNTVAKRNPECLSICCPGDYRERGPRQAQLDSAVNLANWLKATKYPWTEIVGHGEIALPGWGTSCPGKLMQYIKGGT